MKTVVKSLYGSHLYGTDTPESDLDYKGVFIPDGRDILLQQVKHSINTSSKPSKEGRNTKDDVDTELWSLQKFLKLLTEGQVVALDLLFTPDKMILESSPTWDYIRDNKDKLVTNKCHAFVGYCRTQANKYGIKGSRMGSINFVLQSLKSDNPNLLVRDLLETEFFNKYILPVDHVEVIEREQPNGKTMKLLSICGKMTPETLKVKDVVNLCSKIYDEYGKRAEAGRIPFDVIAKELDVGLDYILEVKESSLLPDVPDSHWIEDLILRSHKEAVRSCML